MCVKEYIQSKRIRLKNGILSLTPFLLFIVYTDIHKKNQLCVMGKRGHSQPKTQGKINVMSHELNLAKITFRT